MEKNAPGTGRLPPGQRLVTNWPVLHYGGIPSIDLASWRFRISGLVTRETSLSWDELLALPQSRVTTDIHCVTTWSRYDNVWEGVLMRELLGRAGPLPGARHVVFHCFGGYTTNVPIEELQGDDVLFAHSHDGAPLTAEHGGPLRGVIPHLYFWKSAKWVRAMELVAEDRPGFWEMYGYHMHGDPWTEERYG